MERGKQKTATHRLASEREFLAAREAAEFLGVKPATLYAYASRRLVRSVPRGPGKRGRVYARADLERLKERREARSGHRAVAADALCFGQPVLDSTITAISAADGPIYRGTPALELADADTPYESAAELLWAGSLPAEGAHEPPGETTGAAEPGWRPPGLGIDPEALRGLLPGPVAPIARLGVVVPLLATRDPGRFAVERSAVLPRARTLVRRMAASLVPNGDPRTIRKSFECADTAGAAAWSLGSRFGEEGRRALNRALVLAADHELNASTFAARVAASTGADLYSCVGAALAALAGPRHGGATDRIEALVAEIQTPQRVAVVLGDRARRGEPVWGTAHPLYPQGDPRGRALLSVALELSPESRPVRVCEALAEEWGRGASGHFDIGLVALSLALELPRSAASGIFALGRCAGWVAHALEQADSGALLRPRARYRGSP